jgi:hypothetical protein
MNWPEDRTLRALLEIPYSGIPLSMRDRIEDYLSEPARWQNITFSAVYLNVSFEDAVAHQSEFCKELESLVSAHWHQLIAKGAV